MIAAHFTARHRSMLRAIAEGRGEILAGCRPTLSVDGLWCDFTATNDLISHDLVRSAWPVPVGVTTPAVLTRTGAEALAALSSRAA